MLDEQRPRLKPEDELIIALLRGPEFIDKYRWAIEDMRTTDEDATTIIHTILVLYDKGCLNIPDLKKQLEDRHKAVERVKRLVSDPRGVTPSFFIHRALEVLKENQMQRLKENYGDFPDRV